MVESIKNMTMPLGERIEKIKSNLATTRFKPTAFFDNIIAAGYVKDDGTADVKKFNRAAKRAGIDVSDRSQKNLQKITKFLNLKSGENYQNVGKFSKKSGVENIASQSKGFLGQYAEKYSALTKTGFWEDAIKAQRKVNSLKISSAQKVKKIAQTLKSKWGVPIGVMTGFLTKTGFGKALTMAGAQLTPAAPFIDVALGAPMLVDAAQEVNEQIIQPKVIEPAAKKMVEGENILKRMFTPKMNEGGIMNINNMIRPLRSR